MAKTRFRKQPTVGTHTRAFKQSSENDSFNEVKSLKQTYTLERRFLEYFRSGEVSKYKPAKSFDGGSKWNTPEVKASKNAWASTCDKLKQKIPEVSPSRYVEILFAAVRDSAHAPPTVIQLASPNYLKLYEDYTKVIDSLVSSSLQSGMRSIEVNIFSQSSQDRDSVSRAVYKSLLDKSLSLSPLLRYCVSVAYIKDLKEPSDAKFLKAMKRIAEENKLVAAKEYSTFPIIYDRVWGNFIPQKFRSAAKKLVLAFLR